MTKEILDKNVSIAEAEVTLK